MAKKKKTTTVTPELQAYLEADKGEAHAYNVKRIKKILGETKTAQTPEAADLNNLIKPFYGRYDKLKTVTLEQLVNAQKTAQDTYNKIPTVEKEIMKIAYTDYDRFIFDALGIQNTYFESKDTKRKILTALQEKLGVR
jgi:hypothetical protein